MRAEDVLLDMLGIDLSLCMFEIVLRFLDSRGFENWFLSNSACQRTRLALYGKVFPIGKVCVHEIYAILNVDYFYRPFVFILYLILEILGFLSHYLQSLYMKVLV